MKFSTKLKLPVLAMLTVIVCIPFLITKTIHKRSETIDDALLEEVTKQVYKNISIYDCNNITIYNGGFSDDDLIRLSHFHLVGDKNGSVPASILAQNRPEELKISKLIGYKPQKKEIHLTIDSKLQAAAYKMLDEQGLRGCVLVADWESGEIKVRTSTPAVDVTDLSYIPDTAFLYRPLLAYVPGSIFKAVTFAAALEKYPSARNFTYTCTGVNGAIKCYNNTPHGQQKALDLFSNSCNSGIAALANRFLTPDELDKYAGKFGILSADIVKGLQIHSGNINAGENFEWSANGQGQDLCTPFAVLSFFSTIARGGQYKQMTILSGDKSVSSRTVMAPFTATFLQENMQGVTAPLELGCSSFGKTGTAQLDDDSAPHSWFVCCLTDEAAPKYSILVFLENGGSSEKAKALAGEFIRRNIL